MDAQTLGEQRVYPLQDPQAIHAVAAAAIQGITATDERDAAYTEARARAVGGMTLRQHFAGLLMQAELTTCGVPGAACEALVEAAVAADREVEDQMAFNAVQCADALLRALAEPAPEPPPAITWEQRFQLDSFPAFEKQLRAIKALARGSALPDDLLADITKALEDFDDPLIPF